MKISEHANYLLNEYGRLQFDYAAYCKPNGESLRNEARNNLEEYIAELESKRRWIPVSERLPEEDTDGNTLMAICRHSGEWVRAPFGAEFADEFVRHYSYWMNAPEMPEVQE